MSRLVQKYYSISETAFTFSLGESTVRRKLRAGEFGPLAECLIDGTAIRIPTSGLLSYIEKHQPKDIAQRKAADQVKGRTLGEARRRLKNLQAASPSV